MMIQRPIDDHGNVWVGVAWGLFIVGCLYFDVILLFCFGPR